jgi:hypothetical protein
MAKGKKKTGKPSDFLGKRAELLQEWVPTYSNASKLGKTRQVWKPLFRAYWDKFPWRLPLKQDPDANDPTDYALTPQTAEEEAEYAKLVPEIETVSPLLNR